jgi:ABC-type transporter Mla MlaB component
MFRVTPNATPSGCVLKLEGWLAGPLVQELEACWRRNMTLRHGQQFVVDLTDVQFVDDGGQRLLTDMFRAGVVFVAKGCEMPELVREISDERVAGRT